MSRLYVSCLNYQITNLLNYQNLLLSCGEQIHVQPYRSGYAGRELSEESPRVPDVCAFAVLRNEQAAVDCGAIRIFGLEQRLVVAVPTRRRVKSAFLDPSIEIF